MSTPLAALAARYRFNEKLLAGVTSDLTPEAWAHAPEGGGNAPHWIMGHLVCARRMLARMVGGDIAPEEFEAAFGKGVKPAPVDTYPPVADLISRFEAAGEVLAERLGKMTAEEAGAKAPREFPDGSDTLDGAAHFLYMHEAYHIGQLGYARRLAGLPGLF